MWPELILSPEFFTSSKGWGYGSWCMASLELDALELEEALLVDPPKAKSVREMMMRKSYRRHPNTRILQDRECMHVQQPEAKRHVLSSLK